MIYYDKRYKAKSAQGKGCGVSLADTKRKHPESSPGRVTEAMLTTQQGAVTTRVRYQLPGGKMEKHTLVLHWWVHVS